MVSNGGMISAAGTAFNHSQKTTADLATLWSADPRAAAQWVTDVAAKTGLQVDGLAEVKAILAAGDGFDAAALKELPTRKPQLLSLSLDGLGTLQAARTNTLGWSTDERKAAPVLTGTVRDVNGAISLETSFGTFSVQNAAHTMGGTDMRAFAGSTVSARGWPSVNGSLTVEEFAPGGSTDFTSGRLAPDPKTAQPGVWVSDTKFVQFETPEQAKAYAAFAKPPPYGGSGVLIAGKVAEEKAADGSTTFRLQGANPDLYLLGGYLSKGATGHLQVQTAHGSYVPVIGEEAKLMQPSASGRFYLFGHAASAAEVAAAGLPAGTAAFVAKAVTAACGGFPGVGAAAATPDAGQLVRATMVGRDELPEAHAPFAPAGL